jgi:hypothetical protein
MNRDALKGFEDDVIFKEVANRLRNVFFMDHGRSFQFGYFEFVFHKGELQWIEAHPKYRRVVAKAKNLSSEERGGQQ